MKANKIYLERIRKNDFVDRKCSTTDLLITKMKEITQRLIQEINKKLARPNFLPGGILHSEDPEKEVTLQKK